MAFMPGLRTKLTIGTWSNFTKRYVDHFVTEIFTPFLQIRSLTLYRFNHLLTNNILNLNELIRCLNLSELIFEHNFTLDSNYEWSATVKQEIRIRFIFIIFTYILRFILICNSCLIVASLQIYLLRVWIRKLILN